MPKKDARPGWKGLYLELPEDLDAALRERCAKTGAGVSDEVRLALRRHLAYPPPDGPPPLPSGEQPKPKPKRVRPRRPSANGTVPQE